MDVAGAAAVVTGGSDGLGEQAVRMLVEQGGRAVILDLPESDGDDLAEELGRDVARFIGVDIACGGQVHAAMGEAAVAFGGIDIAISCASIRPTRPTLSADREPHPLEVFRDAIDVNLVGLFDVLRWSAFHMAANDPSPDGERGVIVNVVVPPHPDDEAASAAYAASQAGVVGLTGPVARDLEPWGIRVLAVTPGPPAGFRDRLRELL
jgi:NAD(P)-dependent dehydrogenase (short-subunit alcohol dehydrogenase family)